IEPSENPLRPARNAVVQRREEIEQQEARAVDTVAGQSPRVARPDAEDEKQHEPGQREKGADQVGDGVEDLAAVQKKGPSPPAFIAERGKKEELRLLRGLRKPLLELVQTVGAGGRYATGAESFQNESGTPLAGRRPV